MQFEKVLGQETAKEILKNSIKKGRLAHSYLFTGPHGVGKSLMAAALAAALNCKKERGGSGCGQCVTCKQIEERRYPEFLMITPQGNSIKIDQIRELQNTIGFAPAVGRYRVIVVDMAETMTEEASNSFLKTLEEPPENNILILNTKEPANILPTIVSRCQKIPFAPLNTQVIADFLEAEKALDEASALVIARISEGSLGKAISMVEGGFLEIREQWLRLLGECFDRPRGEVLELASSLVSGLKTRAREKYQVGGLEDLLALWTTWYRDLMVLKEGGEQALIINKDFTSRLKKISNRYNIKNLLGIISLLDHAQKDLRRWHNPLLVMEKTILGIVNLGS